MQYHVLSAKWQTESSNFWPLMLYPMAGFLMLYRKCKVWDVHRQIKGVDMSLKTKTPEEDVQFVLAHVQSFPTESSHYFRKNNPNRRYLSSDLTIKNMYDLYMEKCISELRTLVKENVFNEMFNTKFNISFGSPNSDACNRPTNKRKN